MSRILLYREDGSTEPYDLKTTLFEVRENGVAVVTFNSPKDLHSLTQERRQEMFLILEHINRCDDVKVVVWTASGDRAFCSGASLKPGVGDITLDEEIRVEYQRRGMSPSLKVDIAMMADTRAFWDCKKVIIGAINGLAVGGGANIALMNYFDIVLCSKTAKFKYPFVDIGMTPELGSSMMFPYNASMARAKQVFFTGEWFSAKDAYDWGLVNELHEPKDLLPRALKLADTLAEKHQPQLILSKKLLNTELRARLDDTMRRENETIRSSLEEHGGREALIKKMMKQAQSKM